LSAFAAPRFYVVDDLLGDVPVTVAHKHPGSRFRVFTSSERGTRLKIDLGGMWEGEPMLQAGKVFYLLDSGRLFNPDAGPWPYPELAVERMTWKLWKAAHADTDVYVGQPPSIPPGAEEEK
jgi:hypothetical protein